MQLLWKTGAGHKGQMLPEATYTSDVKQLNQKKLQVGCGVRGWAPVWKGPGSCCSMGTDSVSGDQRGVKAGDAGLSRS